LRRNIHLHSEPLNSKAHPIKETKWLGEHPSQNLMATLMLSWSLALAIKPNKLIAQGDALGYELIGLSANYVKFHLYC